MSIAEDIVEGLQCSGCGTLFVQDHGYPVHCRECWAEMSKSERRDSQKATQPEIGDEEDETY